MYKALTQVCTYVYVHMHTHTHTQDWETDFKLFESGVKVIPMNVKIRNNYAMELKGRGQTEEARKQYQVRCL